VSAIAGIVNFNGGVVDVSDLERVSSALYPYGPDRVDVTVAGPVGLVNMLMRMTPEDRFDHQPWCGASGAIITADLRLDNRDEVLTQIGMTEEEGKELSDSRVLLAAWEMLGDKIWSALRGPFAVAIWEPRTSSLTLARDHLGLNVVMWHKSERFFAFATMPKGLFAFSGVPRQLNEEKFADFLVLNHADLGTTIYRTVYRLLPAHTLTVAVDGSIRQNRYWSYADIAPIRFSSGEDYAKGLRDRLKLAVRRQMRSVHGIGCFLSGGLDSTSIAVLAAQELGNKGERLSAFTQVPRKGFNGLVPNGRYADESPLVDELSKSNDNIDLTYVYNDDCDDFINLERMFAALDGPVRNPMNLGWMFTILELARNQGRRVMLTARHGNFAVSWDGWSQVADHLRRGRLIKAVNQWSLFYRTTSLSRWEAFREVMLKPLLANKLPTRIARLFKQNSSAPWHRDSPINPSFANVIGIGTRAAAFGHDFLYRWHLDDRKAAMALGDFEGDWAQAIKGETGVEIRDPTTDVDVITYCLAIPPEQFLLEGIDRSLIRRAMWGLLPDAVLTNRLRGVQSADWYEKLTDRRTLLAEEFVALSASPLVRRFIDIDRLTHLLNNWPTGDWHMPETVQRYRFVLARGIASSRFLAWLEPLVRSSDTHCPK
jgi:asparagine synthase (glutamine-hydrolysing)